jgi:hypothetical protein
MFVIAKIRLANDPRHIQTKTGTRMESAFGFADVDGDNGLPVGLTAFGSLADELAKYRNGDSIRVSGAFRANNYTRQDGTEVEGWQITIDGLAGVKAARGKYSAPKPSDPLANGTSTRFQDSRLPDSF